MSAPQPYDPLTPDPAAMQARLLDRFSDPRRRKPRPDEAQRQQEARKAIKPFGLPADPETVKVIDRDRQVRFNVVEEDMLPQDHMRALRPNDINNTKSIPDMQYRDLVRATFAKAFEEMDFDLDALTPHRVKAAWRIVRELARHMGLLAADETMAEALTGNSQNADPWRIPTRWATCGEACQQPIWAVVQALNKSEALSEDRSFSMSDGVHITTHKGLALLPPTVPAKWLDAEGLVSSEYDPRHDDNLKCYVEAISAVADHLRIADGAIDDPDLGRYGLMGLLDVNTVRLAMPSRMHIIAWEEIIVAETLQKLIDGGIPQMRQHMVRQYGLTVRETDSLLKMARVHAKNSMSDDIEDDRALMQLRLEDFVSRCRGAADTASEMKAYKQMALILGLGKSDPENQLTDFIDVVKRVGADRKAMSVSTPRQLIDSSTQRPI